MDKEETTPAAQVETTPASTQPEPADMAAEAAKRATNVTTKKIYTQIDAMLENVGGREEGERTLDALKRLLAKPAEQEPAPASSEGEDSKKIYEAQLDAQRKQYDELLQRVEAQKALIDGSNRESEITLALAGKDLAIPSNIPDAAKVQYLESIQKMISQGVGNMSRKIIDGKTFYFDGDTPLISTTTGEAMTTAELIETKFKHFFSVRAPLTTEQLEVMPESKRDEAAATQKVGTYDEAKTLAAKTHERGSTGWARLVHEICKTSGVKI